MDNEIIRQPDRKPKTRMFTLFAVLGFLILVYLFILSAPFKSSNVAIHIPSGRSVDSITEELKENNAIRSEMALKIFIKLLKSGKGIVSGDYLIEKNTPVWVVAWQVGRGYHNIEPTKVTIREGLSNEEIANLLATKLPYFDKQLFLEKTIDDQGYLFPDTYFFYPLDTTEEIIKQLSLNFDKRINKISSSIEASGRSFDDLIIMASILEGESAGREDANLISGILWKRFDLGMPLQVDVDKGTYETKGLPEQPLNNPGLLMIEAAAKPTSSSFLYYLHDKNGKVHFAKSYDEHRVNINNYLR
jgi:UPF0755 protein